MGIEVANYVNQLVAANPLSSDPKSEGDDHLRLLKAVLLATFPNIAGAVTLSHTQINNIASDIATAIATAVLKTGNQSIDGVKTFTSSPVLPGNATTALQAVPKQQLDAAVAPASETVAGVLEIATDAEAQNFTANKAIDGAKLRTAFKGVNNQNINATDGFQLLPGDHIIKYGLQNNAAGGYGAASTTFGSVFPNDCLIVIANYSNASGANLFAPVVTAKSASGFTLYAALLNIFWVAIGY